MIEEKCLDVTGPIITIDQSGLALARGIKVSKSSHAPMVPT